MKKGMKPAIVCPICGKSEVTSLGKLTAIPGLFILSDPGNLFKCQYCIFYFRHPYTQPSELIEKYQEGAAKTWSQGHLKRGDHKLIVEALSQLVPKGSVLDIGCSSGGLLAMLPEKYQKYGIEPSTRASEVAAQHGVTIIGKIIDDCKSNLLFDAILMVDLIEHIVSPGEFLKKATSLLKPTGILIISTGNIHSWLWRIMRLDYWYYFPEHVSFFNKRWFNWFAENNNLHIFKTQTFSHYVGSIGQTIRQLIDCTVYLMLKWSKKLPLLNKALCKVYPFSRASRWPSSPAAHFIADHILVVMQKNPSEIARR
jgi:SAM-dependent methyltransferase